MRSAFLLPLLLSSSSFAQGLPSSSFGFDGLGPIVVGLALSIYLNIRLVRTTGSKWFWLAWPIVFSVAFSVSFLAGIVVAKFI